MPRHPLGNPVVLVDLMLSVILGVWSAQNGSHSPLLPCSTYLCFPFSCSLRHILLYRCSIQAHACVVASVHLSWLTRPVRSYLNSARRRCRLPTPSALGALVNRTPFWIRNMEIHNQVARPAPYHLLHIYVPFTPLHAIVDFQIANYQSFYLF